MKDKDEDNVVRLHPAAEYVEEITWHICANIADWRAVLGNDQSHPSNDFPSAVAIVDGTVIICPLSVGVALCELVVHDFTTWIQDRIPGAGSDNK